MGIALTAIALQSIGTGLVAFFLWQLGRAIHVRFLTSWSIAAVTLAVAVGFLYFSLQLDPDAWACRAASAVYMTGCSLATFLFWSGLREYTRGEPFRLRDLWRLMPFLVVGLLVPAFAPHQQITISVNLVSTAILLACALTSTRHAGRTDRPSVGMPIVQGGMICLVVLFLIHGRRLVVPVEPGEVQDILFPPSLIADAFAELLIFFGTVILACERVRDELERNNAELLKAKTELEAAARTDGLTGLLNRRAFEDWSLANLMENPLGCVASIDLNDLKILNDTHLHAAGDVALKLVGRALLGRFRVTDPIFRMGGDEFAVIMPGGSEAELVRRLEAIDRELENRRLPGVPEPYTLRVAWGVASYGPDRGIESAFQLADREMYAQKSRRKASPPAVLKTSLL